MRLLFVADTSRLTKERNLGVYKKIVSQIAVFKANGFLSQTIESGYVYYGTKAKITKRLPFLSNIDYEKINRDFFADIYYLRHSLICWNLIHFLKEIKKKNPNAIILYEIPTYPYLKELKGLKQLPFVLKDKFNAHKLHKYVDRIISFSDDKIIYNTPTINIINGIDISLIKPAEIKEKSVISLITVASFVWWHGYDRLIKGLGEYYKSGGKRQILIHMVGDGQSEIEKFKKLISEYKLEEQIILYGRKDGEELDGIYNKANLAAASLGLHRIDETLVASTLKTREYAAKGLPVVGSGKVDIFNNDYPYYLELPADESPVDIEKIIKFYDKTYPNTESFEQVNKEIRKFAEKTVDMSITMKPVIDYIKSRVKENEK